MCEYNVNENFYSVHTLILIILIEAVSLVERSRKCITRDTLSILSIHVMLIFNSPVPVIVHFNYETNR